MNNAEDRTQAVELFCELFPGTIINNISEIPLYKEGTVPPKEEHAESAAPAVTEKKIRLHPGKCEYCGQRLVVMASPGGTVLPVEVAEGEVSFFTDDVFASARHKSHLLNCKEMQLNWNEKRKKYIAQANPLAVFQKFAPKDLKDLCR